MEKETFDLESFPTSASALRMLENVTQGFYDNSYVGKWLYQVMGLEYDKARTLVEELPLQMFPETATWGLAYHEIKWGLPVCEHLSYEERRRLIYLKRDFRAPMTPYRIEQYISDAIGFEVKIADVNDLGDYGFIAPHPNVFKVYFIGDGTLDAKKARALLNQLKQSHTTYCMEERIEIQLNNQQLEQIILRNVRFQMRLPFWGEDLYDGTYLFDGAILYRSKKRYGLALGFLHHAGIMNCGEVQAAALAFQTKFYTEETLETRVQLHVGFSFWDLYAVYDGSGCFNGAELFESVRRYALAVRSLSRLTIAEQAQGTHATFIASAGAARSRESAEARTIRNQLGCLALVGWREGAHLAVCAGVDLSEQETMEHLTVETRTSDCQFYDGAVLFDGTQKKWNSIFRKEVIE